MKRLLKSAKDVQILRGLQVRFVQLPKDTNLEIGSDKVVITSGIYAGWWFFPKNLDVETDTAPYVPPLERV